jgi:hypothetical protein
MVVNEIISSQKLARNLDKMTVANLSRQHYRSLDSYFKSSWEYCICLELYIIISFHRYFLNSLYIQFKPY